MSLATENLEILKMSKIELRDLICFKASPCDLYHPTIYNQEKIYTSGEPLHKNFFLEMVEKKNFFLLTPHDQKNKLIDQVQRQLMLTCRKISTGSILQNCKLLLNLMTINQKFLYEFPLSNKILNHQYQAARIFNNFLLKNLDYAPHLYKYYKEQKHFFLYSQAITSSIFLSLVLEKTKFNSKKQIENLFVASLFKDIGMSIIPKELTLKSELTQKEQQIINNHPQYSVDILTGRVPLPKTYINIISEHHTCFQRDKHSPQSNEQIFGIESVLLSAMDIFTAMICDRPYRKANNIYHALEHLKLLMPKQFTSEFRLIVSFFNQFLGKAN